MQDLIKFSHERQRFIMIDPRPPANAFEWRRYVVEESVRRGDKQPDPNTALRRSKASSRAVEKIRETNPMHGIMLGLNKKNTSIDLKPREFVVYNKVKKSKTK
jgi:hypothetical protein